MWRSSWRLTKCRSPQDVFLTSQRNQLTKGLVLTASRGKAYVDRCQSGKLNALREHQSMLLLARQVFAKKVLSRLLRLEHLNDPAQFWAIAICSRLLKALITAVTLPREAHKIFLRTWCSVLNPRSVKPTVSRRSLSRWTPSFSN